MKNILVITPFFYPHIGGSERYIEELYVYFQKHNPGVNVEVLCYNTDNVKEKEEYKGLTIHRIPCYKILKDQFYIPKILPLLSFLIKNRNSYDLIHTSTRFFDSSWWGLLFAKATHSKVVLTDHCAYHPVHKSRIVSFLAKYIDLIISGLFLPLYDAIFVENMATKAFLKQAFNVNSELAYPGIKKVVMVNKKQSKGRIRVVYVGRLIESKGIKTLYDIVDTFPEVDFLFAGTGPLDTFLKEKKRKDGSKNIYLLGKLSKDEVNKLLKTADIFAYPSWHSEGLPLSLLEAGSYGVPVIATNIGGINEVIENNETGLLVDPIDKEEFKKAISKLINDFELRKKLGKKLQKRIKKEFTWQKASEQIKKYL
jgi:glycosyltransferase involved in cell wall biosynthesis